MYMYFYVSLFIVYKIVLASASDYYVTITNDSPTVRGGTVHFQAQLYDENDKPASGSFRYTWRDYSLVRHIAEHKSESPIDWWNVTYPANEDFPLGTYSVQVTVEERYLMFYYYTIASQRVTFNLTEHLNGKLNLIQNTKVINTDYISSADLVTHHVELSPADAEYINKTATSILTYWFIDCVYYGLSNDYTFTFQYSEINQKHKVEALVVAGYEPITTPAPTTMSTTSTTTTTPKPNVTTSTPSTSTKPQEITTIKSQNSLLIEKRIKRISATPLPTNTTFPFVCLNNTTVPPDVNKTYGYFSKKFVVKAPVTNVSVTGNYWLPKGDVLNLMVKCRGSGQFYYCKHIFEGIYNVTGNETCDVPTPDFSDRCEFPIKRFLRKPQKYTIALVIYNDVSKIVSPVTVTVYQVTKAAQLSVIVVPVVSSLVAVVLIVFGIAYYVQSRTRFTVEVADFNFSKQSSDLEYKTFGERLKDSISNAFMRAPSPSSSEPTVWPPGRKYGSLT